MYREPAEISPAETPPAELVYDAVDHEARRKAMWKGVQLAGLPIVASGAASLFVSPTAGLVTLLASSVATVFAWKRLGRGLGARLRVEDGVLCVLPHGGGEAIARIRLAELTGVELDTRAIQRVEEGGSAIPAMRFIDSRVSPEVDKARIVLVSGVRRVPLTQEHLAHMDAVEWFGKIRVFLRRHGWTPASEREEADDDDADEDEDVDELDDEGPASSEREASS